MITICFTENEIQALLHRYYGLNCGSLMKGIEYERASITAGAKLIYAQEQAEKEALEDLKAAIADPTVSKHMVETKEETRNCQNCGDEHCSTAYNWCDQWKPKKEPKTHFVCNSCGMSTLMEKEGELCGDNICDGIFERQEIE